MSLYLGNTPICGGIEGNQLNNPFSLLDYKYSEYGLDNASWLLSNGQYNSGATYSAVYNLLLAIYNGTTTKAGVSVKLSTETYDDTDFVLNTGDTTFRLPLYTQRVLVAKGSSGADWWELYSDGWCKQGGKSTSITNVPLSKEYIDNNYSLVATPTTYSLNAGTIGIEINNKSTSSFDMRYRWNGSGVSGSPEYYWEACGYASVPSISDYTEIKGLYFYVGETVQDANVIAAGQALTDIANLKAHYITETYVNGTSGYRVWSDGYCEQWGSVTSLMAGVTGTQVVFLKEFKDTNYYSSPNASTSVSYVGTCCHTFTTSSMYVTNRTNDTINCKWQASGYIS